VASQFTGDYGLTPNEANDYVVIGLITQMGGDLFKPNPALEAIAVWLVNRYGVTNLKHLQFLWTPDSQECGGNDEAYSCTYTPGFFRAVNLDNGQTIPTQFAQYDDGQATYYLGFKPNAAGKPIFGLVYANPRTHGVLKGISLPLLAITSMVFDWSGTLGAAILGVGDAVAGAALAGEIALEVGLTGTQVAQIVGSSAAGAVTSGGDPVKAIENAAASFLGAQAGNFVAGAVDSAAAAKIASAAVTAAAKGQDIGRAILTSGATTAAGAAAGAITSGSTMDDILFPTDEFAFGYDPNVDIFQNYVPATGDVVVTPSDLGLTETPTIDESALQRTGFDENAVLFDDEGDGYGISGQTVAYTAKTYMSNLYVDPKTGDVYGPDNIRRLTGAEAAAVVQAGAAGCTTGQTWKTVAGLGAVCLSPGQSIAQEIERRMAAQAGQIVIPGPGLPGRPADTPPPNPNGVKLPEAVGWAAAAEAITKSAANVWTIITQVSNGTYRPGATNPIGTVRPPVPGVPVRQADGSVVVNNGNGTQTITYPNGTSRTVSTAVAGTSAFGGISSNTLLIAGAGLAALLLLRRK
jgi:hypothetical protein